MIFGSSAFALHNIIRIDPSLSLRMTIRCANLLIE